MARYQNFIQIIGKVFGKLYGKDYDSGMHFSSLIGSIKIDFATFLEFHEKYKLRKLLEKLEADEPDEETKLKIYKAMDIDGDGLISEFEFKQWAKKTLQVKFIYSEKATIYLSYLCSNGQINGGDFANFCGLLRISELY